MKVLLSVVVILAFYSTVNSIVCPVDYCDTVTCQEIAADSCDGKVVANGGFCGCCDHCVSILNEGDSCFELHIRGGLPPNVRCDDGLQCDFTTHTCIKA